MWGMNQYRHLSITERETLFLGLSEGKSYREIGKILNRSYRTIGREVQRNSVKSNHPKRVEYFPSKAQKFSEERRKQSKVGKLDDPALSRYVINKLGRHWSPEQIAGRLKRKIPHLSVSPEAVYQFVYNQENRKERFWEFLRRRHPRRQLFNGRKTRNKAIPGRIFIENRPEKINSREEIGHWETDLMEGVKSENECLSVFAERKTGFIQGEKLPDKRPETKAESTIKLFDRKPRQLIQTITLDNGLENYRHQKMAEELRCQTYFCHPYHAWEKGTVENTIGLIRQYIPKKTPLSTVTKSDISQIFWELNNRPRKRLGFLTPLEVFFLETGWVT